MGPLVVKTNKIKSNKFGVLTIFQILNQQHTPEMSVTKIKIDGLNDRVRNKICNAAYLVVAGQGRFILGEGNKEVKVGIGDLVYIPKGNWYQDEGKMTMLSFYSPAFYPEQIEKE